MQTYANALLVAIPAFMVLIIIEAVYGVVKGKQTLHSFDTISSLSSGITNVIKDSLGVVIIIVSYPFLHQHLALLSLDSSVLVYLVGFVAMDFAGYWSHRLNHSVNIFWNNHVIHHSSEEFNLACALRQSISNIIGIYALFLVPAAVLGVPANVINLLAPIHLFLQFWYHTRHVPKLGVLEYVIITPSQHRVHHAINPEYLDKNLGQIFPWWDRMFGTFQEELDDVPPVYGITRPAQTWNPIRINFQHVWLLIKDAWRTRNWLDKVRIWFMPTGWRPPDVADLYPVHYIGDVNNFEKYNAPASRALVIWSWFQFVMTALLLLYMLYGFTAIGFPDLFVYGGFVFAGIYGFTSLMDQLRSGPWIEILRGVAGIAFIAATSTWFEIGALLPFGDQLVAAYFGLTALGGLYFTSAHRRMPSVVPIEG
ncbi:MAG: sterol desaturase family protein [Bacteroidota bacterium]